MLDKRTIAENPLFTLFHHTDKLVKILGAIHHCQGVATRGTAKLGSQTCLCQICPCHFHRACGTFYFVHSLRVFIKMFQDFRLSCQQFCGHDIMHQNHDVGNALRQANPPMIPVAKHCLIVQLLIPHILVIPLYCIENVFL